MICQLSATHCRWFYNLSQERSQDTLNQLAEQSLPTKSIGLWSHARATSPRLMAVLQRLTIGINTTTIGCLFPCNAQIHASSKYVCRITVQIKWGVQSGRPRHTCSPPFSWCVLYSSVRLFKYSPPPWDGHGALCISCLIVVVGGLSASHNSQYFNQSCLDFVEFLLYHC